MSGVENDDGRGTAGGRKATHAQGAEGSEISDPAAFSGETPVPGAKPSASTPAPDTRERRDRRQTVVDRRHLPTGLERRGPGRRRSDFIKSAEEGQMSQEQFLFVMAIDAYKRVNQKPFPTWTEVLEIIRKLGYRKTCASVIQMGACEDWTEASNAMPFPPKLEPEPQERAEALRGETDEND